MILADTSCWIEYFHPKGSRRVKDALGELIRADRLAVCGAVVCEIMRGASGPDIRRLRRVLGGLHYLQQLDRDWATVEHAAVRLQRRGQQPPLMDLLIAAVARRSGAVLCHFGDRHFLIIGTALPLDACDLSTDSPPWSK